MENAYRSLNTRLCLTTGMIVAQYGLTETKSLMTEIGPEVVNRDKIYSIICV